MTTNPPGPELSLGSRAAAAGVGSLVTTFLVTPLDVIKSRQQMVWTVMHVAERLEILPSEMWLLIFTFVKHERQ